MEPSQAKPTCCVSSAIFGLSPCAQLRVRCIMYPVSCVDVWKGRAETVTFSSENKKKRERATWHTHTHIWSHTRASPLFPRLGLGLRRVSSSYHAHLETFPLLLRNRHEWFGKPFSEHGPSHKYEHGTGTRWLLQTVTLSYRYFFFSRLVPLLASYLIIIQGRMDKGREWEAEHGSLKAASMA